MIQAFSDPPLMVRLLVVLGLAVGVALVVDLLLWPVRWWFERRSHYPRVAQGLRLIRVPVAMSLVLVSFGVTVQSAGADGTLWFVVRGVLLTAGITAWTWASFRLLSVARESLRDNQDRWAFAKPQVLSLVDVAARALATLLAVYVLMLAWSIDLTAWLAGAGVVGIAVGFAAKDILSNLIGGVTVIIEAPYTLGDRLEVEGGTSGIVTYIGLRSTWLETYDGKQVVVPNSTMMNATVVNLSAGPTPYTRTQVIIPVPYGPDPEVVVPLLLAAVSRSDGVVLDDPRRLPQAAPNGLTETSVQYQVRFWTLSPGGTSRAVTTNCFRLLRASGVRFRAAIEEVAPRASDRPEVTGALKAFSPEAIDALLIKEKPVPLRRTLVVSDLYLGDGGAQDIFAGGEALPVLLDQLSSEEPTRVILNGNTLDFLFDDAPLVIESERVVSRARVLVEAPGTARVLQALGRVVAAGGEVILRAGNQDAELLLPEVQVVIREALGQPPEIARRLVVEADAAPRLLEIAGARIAIIHGHQRDGRTRIDYERLSLDASSFRYPPASTLAREVLVPLSREHELHFVDLLRPDASGAALAALAVDPGAVKAAFNGDSKRMMWQFLRRSTGALSFGQDAEAVGPELGLADLVEEVGLSEDEEDALAGLLEEGPLSFAGGAEGADDEGAQTASRARVKLLRAGVKHDTRAQKKAEWKEAQRQATLHRAGAVLGGYTHVAGAGQQKGLTYMNTGTWSRQLKLPELSATTDEWSRFLRTLQVSPAPTYARFTAALVETHSEGGASLKLVEWGDDGMRVLESYHITS